MRKSPDHISRLLAAFSILKTGFKQRHPERQRCHPERQHCHPERQRRIFDVILSDREGSLMSS
jgi:hypothetical protein